MYQVETEAETIINLPPNVLVRSGWSLSWAMGVFKETLPGYEPKRFVFLTKENQEFYQIGRGHAKLAKEGYPLPQGGFQWN